MYVLSDRQLASIAEWQRPLTGKASRRSYVLRALEEARRLESQLPQLLAGKI
jgi:hypothetical protein